MDNLEQLGLLEDDEIELDMAALTLSALDHHGVHLAPYYALLDDIEDRLREIGTHALTVEQQSACLKQVFSDECGFAGDEDAYGAPINADLIRVLDRKKGLPVSLSILYVSAARRMGWEAYALATPGHVLVRIGNERFTLIDPFNGGEPVSSDRLLSIVRRYMGPEAKVEPEYLRPVPNRAVLIRLLGNQASRAEQEGDKFRALLLHTRMTIVAPEYSDVWWETARLQLEQSNHGDAKASLSAMLEVTRDTDRRDTIKRMMERLRAH